MIPLTTKMFISQRYDKDAKWRSAWNDLAHDFERGRKKSRTCTQQEYIEHRANLANRRIGVLMLIADLHN